MIFNIGDKCRRNVLVSCDHGLMIVNRFDCNSEQVGHGQWLLDHGNTSTVEAQHCFSAIGSKENPIVFDVGANIGTFTTWLANTFPKGKVFAFEPQRAVFQILCGNVAINNLYNVYTYNCGVGKINEVKSFEEPNYFSKDDFGTFSLVEDIIKQKSGDSIQVDIVTLDSFCEKHKIQTIDLIKVDAEGMDLDVLEGATNLLTQCKPALFVEHCDNRKSIIGKLQKFLDQFKYQYTLVGNNVLCT